MQRHTLRTALVFATVLGTLTTLVTQQAGTASAATRGNAAATDPSGIDAFEYERAAVTLDGRVLFQVRGVPAYPADERAKAMRQRIEEIAANRSVAIESLRVVEMEDRTRVMAGDRLGRAEDRGREGTVHRVHETTGHLSVLVQHSNAMSIL